MSTTLPADADVTLAAFAAMATRAAGAGVWIWCVEPPAARVIGGPPAERFPSGLVPPDVLSAASPPAPAGDRDDRPVCRAVLPWRANHRDLRVVGLAWAHADAARAAAALGLGPDQARGLACPLLDGTPRARRAVRAVLEWTLGDGARAARDAIALSQFGDRLAQSYEEFHALLRLAALLRGMADPEATVVAVCGQLAEVLGFGWVGLAFDDAPAGGVVPALRGRTIETGAPPADFAHLAGRLLATARAGDPVGPVLTVTDSPLARAAGTEAIAHPVLHGDRVIGVLTAGGKTVDPDVTSGEVGFVEAAARLLGVYHENVAHYHEQRRTFLGTLRALTAAVDAKDPYTRGHSERVAFLAAQMAQTLNMSGAQVEQFHIAGLVHDVGKIGVPEAVLRKPGRLDDAEFEQIKRHPEIGHRILCDIPGLAVALPGVLHHHEKWNGTGYPHRLAGEQIPPIARVLALADTFDAMSSDRSYRTRLSRDQVVAEIVRSAGSQFDPALVPTFVAMDFTAFDAMLASAGARQNASSFEQAA